jgi:hypothetical protein
LRPRPFVRQAPLPRRQIGWDTEPSWLLWDLYVEPAIPSLPSMCRRFTPPHSTSRIYTTAQVRDVEAGAELDAVIGLDDLNPEREPLQ